MSEPSSPHDQLMRFVLAKWISKPLYVVAELGVADQLAEEARSVEQLARSTGSNPEVLYRLMRALASVGIFRECGHRRFTLTPMAACLKEGSLRAAARTFNCEWNDTAWMHLLECTRSGGTPFEKAFGQPLVRWLETHPGEAAQLHRANTARAAQTLEAILAGYNFAGIDTLVDVGGGEGAMLAGIVKETPGLRGILADRGEVLHAARSTFATAGVAERCSAIECDFFRSLPGGGDAYLLANVLHDWPDEQAKQILHNCRTAMKPDSRLLVVELLVSGPNEPSTAKLLDLEMLVTTGGRERSEEEFRFMFDSAGLILERALALGGGVFVLEAS